MLKEKEMAEKNSPSIIPELLSACDVYIVYLEAILRHESQDGWLITKGTLFDIVRHSGVIDPYGQSIQIVNNHFDECMRAAQKIMGTFFQGVDFLDATPYWGQGFYEAVKDFEYECNQLLELVKEMREALNQKHQARLAVEVAPAEVG